MGTRAHRITHRNLPNPDQIERMIEGEHYSALMRACVRNARRIITYKSVNAAVHLNEFQGFIAVSNDALHKEGWLLGSQVITEGNSSVDIFELSTGR